MSLPRLILRRLRALFRKETLDSEMSEEMRAHLELQAAENVKRGMAPDEARYTALRAFGGVEQIKEHARAQRGFVLIEHFRQDLRYVGRSLRKNPVLTVAATLTLALGLGATSAIFSVVDALVWRPLPYAESHRLVQAVRFTGLALRDWREAQSVLDRIETHLPRSAVLTGGAEPLQISIDAVAPGLFGLLGRTPALGRPFTVADAEAGHHRVALLSDGFWRRHFGGDPGVVGRTLTLDDEVYEVIGVMPRGFAFPRLNTALWTPLLPAISEADMRRRVEVVGRLRPGLEFPAAKEAITALNRQLDQTRPQPRGWEVQFLLLEQTRMNPGPRKMALLVLGAVGFVLLIACFNVANLLLVRATVREREFAVRIALGAERGRLIRQVLTESLVLVLAGTLGGILLAHWLMRAIWLLAPQELTFLSLNEARLDWRVLGFMAALAGLATLFCGLVPALRASDVDSTQAFGASARTATGSRRQRRWQNAFIVAQSALAFVLLVGAGLMLRGFLRLGAVAPGFEVRNLVALSVQLPSPRYRAPAQREVFFSELIARVAALPGVKGVAHAVGIPPRGGGISFSPAVEVEGRLPEKLGVTEMLPSNIVDENYFSVMGIPLRRGRNFDRRDGPGAPAAVVINDQMARRFWPGGDPIGQRIRFDPQQAWLTVVGVAGDVKAMGLADENGALEYYRPMTQESSGSYSTLVVRTGIDSAAVMPALRREVLALDPKLPIAGLATAETLMAETLALGRFFLFLLSAFAGTAVLLAAIGLYGVMSCTTAQRAREIGIRLALGGNSTAIVRLVVGHGAGLIGGGLLLGATVAIGLTRYLEAMLFEISALDPATFGGVAVVLGLSGLLACWLPARRAARVDPMVVLRTE